MRIKTVAMFSPVKHDSQVWGKPEFKTQMFWVEPWGQGLKTRVLGGMGLCGNMGWAGERHYPIGLSSCAVPLDKSSTELNKYLYCWSRRETTRVPAVLVTTAKAMYEYDLPSNLALPMSQPPSHIPTPLATAVWDWAAVPDSAIWSDSNDNEVIAKAKWEEAQHWEQEEIECQEKAEGNHWELAEHQEREAQAHQEQESMGRHEAQHQQRVPKAKGGCQLSTCPVLGTKKSQKHVMPEETVGTKTKCVPEESMSLRAGEKKKHVRAKSPEVEIAIDWHTEEMVQLQQMVKLLSSSHRHVIKSMVELLQETTYPVPQALEVPAESSSEESAIDFGTRSGAG
ncbi:hypothetical protein F5141DRAFT_1062681 [Pisolithus sp. B1]|nr:hypothetical protein F5141DRAFT_1062681 [Pisolithus sp. B1]